MIRDLKIMLGGLLVGIIVSYAIWDCTSVPPVNPQRCGFVNQHMYPAKRGFCSVLK